MVYKAGTTNLQPSGTNSGGLLSHGVPLCLSGYRYMSQCFPLSVINLSDESHENIKWTINDQLRCLVYIFNMRTAPLASNNWFSLNLAPKQRFYQNILILNWTERTFCLSPKIRNITCSSLREQPNKGRESGASSQWNISDSANVVVHAQKMCKYSENSVYMTCKHYFRSGVM